MFSGLIPKINEALYLSATNKIKIFPRARLYKYYHANFQQTNFE